MPIPREIDLSKPKLSGQWLLAFFVIVIVLALIVGLALWVSNAVKTAVAGPAGSKRRLEERRI